MTTADPRAEAYEIAVEAMEAYYAGASYKPATKWAAQLVVDAVWEHLTESYRDGSVWKMLRDLEAELAQSQAEVKLRGEYAHDLFRELRAERALADELAAELARWGWGDFHYGETPQEPRVAALVEKHRVARSGAQGDDS